MNLAEALVSSLVFAGAACASAQVLGMGMAWDRRVADRQRAEERLDLGMVLVEVRARELMRAVAAGEVPAAAHCREAAGMLAADLGATLAAHGEGVAHRAWVEEGEAGVSAVQITVGVGAGLRHRRLDPLAIGLCPPAPAGERTAGGSR